MSNNGNSKDIIGERIGGDGDDYILGEIGIPSVTAELGTEGQYIEEWQVKNLDEALKICQDNSQYLEFTYEKLGAQLALTPVKFERLNDQYMRIYLNVTNKGMSDVASVPLASTRPQAASLVQLGDDDWIQDALSQVEQPQGGQQNQTTAQAASNTTTANGGAPAQAAKPSAAQEAALSPDIWAPEIRFLAGKSNFKATLVDDPSAHPELAKLVQGAAASAPQALVTGAETFTLPGSLQNLKARDTQTIQFLVKYDEKPGPLGVDLRFQYQKFSTSPSDERFEMSLNFAAD